jgi:hypothetical protein
MNRQVIILLVRVSLDISSAQEQGPSPRENEQQTLGSCFARQSLYADDHFGVSSVSRDLAIKSTGYHSPLRPTVECELAILRL